MFWSKHFNSSDKKTLKLQTKWTCDKTNIEISRLLLKWIFKLHKFIKKLQATILRL